MNFNIESNHNDERSNYEDLETVLRKTVQYLAFFSEDKPVKTICKKPDSDFSFSDTRSVIHTLIFNHRLASYKEYGQKQEAFFTRCYFTIREKDENGRPSDPPVYKKENCKHGNNCPIVIGTLLFIWIYEKFGAELPPNYKNFSGCRFYHDSHDVSIMEAKVNEVMKKIDEEYMTTESSLSPIFLAMSRTYNFAKNHDDAIYPLKKIRVIKLNNFTDDEKGDVKKRVKDIPIRIFDDKIFSTETNQNYDNLSQYNDRPKHTKTVNLSRDPNDFYTYTEIPDVTSTVIFPKLSEKKSKSNYFNDSYSDESDND